MDKFIVRHNRKTISIVIILATLWFIIDISTLHTYVYKYFWLAVIAVFVIKFIYGNRTIIEADDFGISFSEMKISKIPWQEISDIKYEDEGIFFVLRQPGKYGIMKPHKSNFSIRALIENSAIKEREKNGLFLEYTSLLDKTGQEIIQEIDARYSKTHLATQSSGS